MPIGVILGACSALLTALVTEVYAHRCLAHHAFAFPPRADRVLNTYFRVVVGTDPESWAAVHRLHHRYADTPRDPHSPVQRRPATVLLGSAYLFAKAKALVAPDRPKGVRILAIRLLVVGIELLLLGPAQLGVMFLVHLVGYLGIQGTVNTVGHLYGRKPHPEAAGYDLAWLAIPLLGHGYHNSHHAHPGAARTGRLDPIWPLLRLGATVGLVDLASRSHTPAAVPACCKAAVSLATSAP